MTAAAQARRPRLLQAGPLLPALEQALAAACAAQCLSDQTDPQAFLAAQGADFDGYVTSAVMGLVGAGGLGQLMDTSVRMLNGGEVGAILLVFMVLVLLTEMVSWLVRKVLA